MGRVEERLDLSPERAHALYQYESPETHDCAYLDADWRRLPHHLKGPRAFWEALTHGTYAFPPLENPPSSWKPDAMGNRYP